MMDTGRLYGDSLYDLAAEEKLTETLMGQVEMVAEVLKENPEYLTLLSEPSVAKAERMNEPPLQWPIETLWVAQ